MGLTIEVIYPLIGLIEGNKGYDALVLVAFLLNITLCSLIFAWYFASPLWFMMSWIQQLTQLKYETPITKGRVYTKKNKLRKPYKPVLQIVVHQ